jgi:two-component system NtrC family response regulator
LAAILIIDDDRILCNMLTGKLAEMGHAAAAAHTLKEGLEAALAGAHDVVLLDVRMPDGNGLSVLSLVQNAPSRPEVIIITGQGDPDGAELAIRNGAWDYIEKPSTMKEMILPITRALQYREEKMARRRPARVLKRDDIVGSSPQMRACLELLAQAADSDINVLITGETGTGKELFAQAIHQNSARVDGRFIVVDCTALPENLVEAMLFGHEKGAFTGADKAREGMIAQADGGTLFLDEVGELPLSIQKTFLRALQEHRFRPLGGKHEIESRFRLISATNKNMDEMVEKGAMRGDLLFRLRSLAIPLPALREHPEDIKALVLHHTAKSCERIGVPLKGFSPDFLDVLTSYEWPGNVRELVNALESAINVARYENTLFPRRLPTNIRIRAVRASLARDVRPDRTEEAGASPGNGATPPLPPMRSVRDAVLSTMEKDYLEKLMALCAGDMDEACRVSLLSRPRLYALLKKHGISH